MRNLSDVLKNYHETVAAISYHYIDFLLSKRNLLDEVFSIFSDDYSKYLYGQELISVAFRRYMQSEVAAQFTGPLNYTEFRQQLQRARNLFPEIVAPDDEESKFYAAQTKCTAFIYDQYNYRNIVRAEKGDVCLDIGACIGDSALTFLQKGAQKVYSFDIDKICISCMQQTFQKLHLEDRVTLVQAAVSSKQGSCWFTPSILGGGRISFEDPKNDKAYQVPVTTLNQWVQETKCRPTFIKMDIEGAEISALEGGKEMIQEYKPKLAICIYHTWEHRYQIPLLLKEYLPDAQFYLKKSHPEGEVVIFVKP